MKKHLAIFIIGGVIGVLLFTFLFYNEPDLWYTYRHVIFLSAAVGVLVAYLVIWLSKWLAQVTHWHKRPGLNLLCSIVGNTAVVFGTSALYLFTFHEGYLELSVSDGVYTKLAILSFVAVLLFAVVYLVITSYQYLQQSMLDAVQLESRQVDLQLAALKSQLTPHFLFNSLNTISSLLHKGPQVTETYIRNLAKVYQYTLPTYDKKLVPFLEEWAFVQANVELVKERFGGSISVKLDNVSELTEVQMPPLTLQLLIENALKHNQIGKKQPLEIVVSRNGGWWQVTNNITAPPKQVTSFKVGLRNIKERYQLLGGKPVEVKSAEEFTVKLPVL
ncbi:sensor histidine kinase [Marinoscillum sp.]|uniref:sensor histidine kinase n=1 Tax=Marinoscillum sp. TaxID=2024838 RepID=UPI003BAD5BDD